MAARATDKASLLASDDNIVPERVHAGVAHICVRVQIVERVESRVWIAALAPAVTVVVFRRIHAGSRHIGILRQVISFGELGADRRDSLGGLMGVLQRARVWTERKPAFSTTGNKPLTHNTMASQAAQEIVCSSERAHRASSKATRNTLTPMRMTTSATRTGITTLNTATVAHWSRTARAR